VVDVSAWNSNNDARIQTWTAGGGSISDGLFVLSLEDNPAYRAFTAAKALEVLGAAKDDATPHPAGIPDGSGESDLELSADRQRISPGRGKLQRKGSHRPRCGSENWRSRWPARLWARFPRKSGSWNPWVHGPQN
jgi:hypothetical protein